MNGAHDLGGQMGFGPVAPEMDEPFFHAKWEKRAMGLTLCSGALGAWTLDESRHTRESLHPAVYYGSSYYEIWERGVTALLVRHGFVSEADLAAGHAVTSAPSPKRLMCLRRWRVGGRPTGRWLRQRSSLRDSGCAGGTSIRKGIPVCPAMHGGSSA